LDSGFDVFFCKLDRRAIIPPFVSISLNFCIQRLHSKDEHFIQEDGAEQEVCAAQLSLYSIFALSGTALLATFLNAQLISLPTLLTY